jgi:hypothetical protein
MIGAGTKGGFRLIPRRWRVLEFVLCEVLGKRATAVVWTLWSVRGAMPAWGARALQGTAQIDAWHVLVVKPFPEPQRQGHGNDQIVIVSLDPGREGLMGRPGVNLAPKVEQLALEDVQ